jgi:hypothetical protein
MMIQINESPMVCLYDSKYEAVTEHAEISQYLKDRNSNEECLLKEQKVRSVGFTSSVWVLTVVAKQN